MKFLLVGTAFTPGAPAVLTHGLPQHAPVELRAEPENPYDANAVRVLVHRAALRPGAELDAALAGFGLSVETIAWPLPLGHLGAKPETKAAKRAIAGGHRFELCATWHELPPGDARTFGRLVQCSDGTVLVEVGASEGGSK